MTRQDNFTTVEPMTEAEAMQAARENMVYLEQFAYLVWNLNEKMPFSEARKKAIKVAEEKGDDFVHYAVPEEIYPPETMLAYCFPELSEKNIAAVLKWKRKRDRARMRSEGRRSRSKRLWRIFGEAHWRCRRLCLSEQGFVSEEAELWTESFMRGTGETTGEETSPGEHLHTLERSVKVSVVFQHMINRRYSGRRFCRPMRATYRPRTSSRSRRSPVRSAAKSGGDDNGGDGDSDQGEPPKPSHKGRAIPLAPIQARQFLLTHKPNSLSPSRTPHPCHWCMDWRWAV
ncbi:hypothetical protein SDC9_56249 [bioreactor metagenome]|uniref:Uncharacterized protein n=1 Tax=bioreactor metagenome TaxID=1076179 RepID=A0A644X183_9ZZZZ